MTMSDFERRGGGYWPTCSYHLTQRSHFFVNHTYHSLTLNDQIWYSNLSRENHVLTGQHGPVTLESVSNIVDCNICQVGMTCKSNQILQGDQKWQVTFYRVHHAPRHSEQSVRGGANICDAIT